ncbi:MAG: DNA polymerase III subunit delta' [Bacteroidaceae bacterium]|nr:DNA polymerase III subunit delta' [Bacteroidaceae bacterium]
MNFSTIIAQESIKQRLRQQLITGQIPHAQLFCGPDGCGKLPMALAFAKALLCQNPKNGEACEECRSCKMLHHWEHPDLHFIYPIKKTQATPLCKSYLPAWREELTRSPYLDSVRWNEAMQVENQQPCIYVADADAISETLYLAAQQGGYRVVIIWKAEVLMEQAANKLLKILEEPPAHTVFLLITSNPNNILPTILSRTQRIQFNALTPAELTQVLTEVHGLSSEDALPIARSSSGSYIQAVRQLQVNEEREMFFDMFVQLMRKCYLRDIREMHRWSELVAEWGRTKQKDFLQYCQHLIRENFIFNFHQPELNYMSKKERDFSVRFSPFINEKNVINIMNELSLAERDIAQNVNARMVFFDFALKMIVLLIQK